MAVPTNSIKYKPSPVSTMNMMSLAIAPISCFVIAKLLLMFLTFDLIDVEISLILTKTPFTSHE
ncbi:hypothetical protein [Spirosoma gilvum]